jgi:purine-binding chemotaxis protein CheW
VSEQEPTESTLNNVAAGLEHFDPFQGFIDDSQQLNLRYGFRLGEINFLTNELAMSEVVIKPTIYSIPNTPSWIVGLLNLRGILVPVLNIKKQIGQEEVSDDKDKNTLLILDKGERAFAMFIDALPVSINLDDDEFVKTTVPENIPKILDKYCIGAFSLKQEVWLEVDYDAFIQYITRDFSDFQTDE